ncbi:hypothetical protein AHIS2_p029 [Acaryochloris phage A-HIS2]|nr:hypothetical protein AHIS2_p029 [Acaryochloris phage A-HIS2]
MILTTEQTAALRKVYQVFHGYTAELNLAFDSSNNCITFETDDDYSTIDAVPSKWLLECSDPGDKLTMIKGELPRIESSYFMPAFELINQGLPKAITEFTVGNIKATRIND